MLVFWVIGVFIHSEIGAKVALSCDQFTTVVTPIDKLCNSKLPDAAIMVWMSAHKQHSPDLKMDRHVKKFMLAGTHECEAKQVTGTDACVHQNT